MELLKNMADTLTEYKKSVAHILSDEPVPLLVTGLSHIHKAHFLAALCYEKLPSPVLVITESEASAAKLTEDINTMCGDTAAYQFPASDLTLADTEAQSQEYEYKRIETLSAALWARQGRQYPRLKRRYSSTVPKDKNLLTFSGFADWWREETNYGKTIFLSEPQFWVNLNRIKGVNKNFNLSVGSEVELSNNFGGRDGFYVIPTLALKWTLN